MSFRILPIFGIAIALFGGSACGVKLGEGPPSGASFELGDGCLTGSAAVVDRYLGGSAQDTEIARVWDCASKSLQMFAESTRGDTQGLYSAKELRAFLENYFLDGVKISDGILEEMMEVKRTLLGGRADALTFEELEGARRILGILREHTVRLRPYMPLSAEHAVKMSAADLDEGIRRLTDAAKAVGSVLQKNGTPYPFSRMERLLREVQALTPNSDYQAASASIRELIPLVQELKAVFVSPGKEAILADDWPLAFVTGAEAYGLYLRANRLMKSELSFLWGEGREGITDLARDGYSFADQVLARRPRQHFLFEEMDRLVDLMDDRLFRIGDYAVSRANIKSVLRPLVQNGLGRGVKGEDGRSAPGLGRPALRRLLSLIEQWSEGQSYIERVFALAGGTGSPLHQSFEARKLDQTFNAVYGKPETALKPATRDGARLVRKIILEARPLYQEDETEISFEPSGREAGHGGGKLPAAPVVHSFSGLTALHWMNLLGYLLPEAYSQDPARISNPNGGVTVAEFEAFFFDLRPIGLDLRIFDPENLKIAQKRFLEGNLFMFRSDGNNLLSPGEVVDLLAYVLSAKFRANRMHWEIARLCGATGEKATYDFYGFPDISVDCYREKYYSGLEGFYKRMPLFHDYYRKLVEEEKRAAGSGGKSPARSRKALFQCYIEEGARPDGFLGKIYQSSDSEGMSGIVQYLETVYLRFDRDGSTTLDLNEAMEAYQLVFKDVLKTASCAVTCLEKEEDLQALFTYLLAYGTLPSTSDLKGLIKFGWWRYFSGWKFEADRTRLLQIIALVSKATGSGLAGYVDPCAKFDPAVKSGSAEKLARPFED